MRIIKKNVYYCDFCKKKGLSSGALKKHEKHCTGNPNRECRMCGVNGNVYEEFIKSLKSRYEVTESYVSEDSLFKEKRINWIGKEITVEEIRKEADGCPACMLSIFKLAGMFQTWISWDFNFENEGKQYLREHKYGYDNGYDY